MIEMTTGSVSKAMLRFALPLMLGSIFQQLYNTVDAMIVGRLLGKEALAAVGSAGSIVNVLLFVVVGVCLGTAVFLAQHYGAGDHQVFQQTMGTLLVAGLLFTLALILLSLGFSGLLLRMIRTPAEILAAAARYLRICIAGLVFSFLYNCMSACLRAIGSVRVPNLVLAGCCLLNALLDWVLIRYAGMGVAGAALATVISQGVAAGLCVLYIRRRVPLLCLGRDALRIHRPVLGAVAGYSLSYAVQQSFLYLGMMIVQGAANRLGVDSMAAYNAVTKINGFAQLPAESLSAALATFVAQNLGAREHARVRSGLRCALVPAIGYCVVLAVALPLCARGLVRLFLTGGDQAVLAIGGECLGMLALLYPLFAVCNTSQGFFRGLGQLRVVLAGTALQIPVRVVLSHALLTRLQLNAIPVATGVGWVGLLVFQLVMYRRLRTQPDSPLGAV